MGYSTPGGWWWTGPSPTGSGPEGSSPNESEPGRRQPPLILLAPLGENSADTMANVEQRLSVLEERVAFLQDAYERNMEFIGKKLAEHALRLDRMEGKIDLLDKKFDVMSADIASMRAGLDALPAVIARTFDEVLKAHDKQQAN
jgi:uncharacterized coiled-coil protein SlyX